MKSLAPCYHGPFQILQRIGAVAQKLDLPHESRIRPIFHVSLLKEKLGAHVSTQVQLPLSVERREWLLVQPQAMLDKRTRQNKDEILVHRQGLAPTEATGENLQLMKNRFPE